MANKSADHVMVRSSQILGKRVLREDGRDLGRVDDLVGERRADELTVSCLLISRGHRFRRARLLPRRRRRIPWSLVIGIDDDGIRVGSGRRRQS